MGFKLKLQFSPAGGQPETIKQLTEGNVSYSRQTLLGITGSGKTFVMANLIQNIQKPTLVLAHNKTLAAQLYAEFKELFPENRVEYFVSYFDYYQPESYLPTSDTYIEKDSAVNEKLERMRLKSMASLLSRRDVIIVASISCIYGIGNPQDFFTLHLSLQRGQRVTRQEIISSLVKMQYERNDDALEAGRFRVRGGIIDVIPAYDEIIVRIELFGNEVDKISERHHITGEVLATPGTLKIFPAKQFVFVDEKREHALVAIEEELKERVLHLPPLEADRLTKRVKYDLEMIREMGYCSGIENYSRHFDGRGVGEPPSVLLDYFSKDFLLIIDESHQTIPQAHAMYHGDHARKKNLVDFGFRLPSAFDNRPLKFEEFEKYFDRTLFVSATPGDYEIKVSGQVVELIIRPTALLDPIIEVKPIDGQIKGLIEEIRSVTARGERTLVTTLTKRMAEELTNYLAREDIRVRYLHSEIKSLDRIEIIRQLRVGEFDVLVGINLLREGLDIPEVALVAILDADKAGFLRNERSLIQIIGRAARNLNGRVIMYADLMTEAMKQAIEKTRVRRIQQEAYNKEKGITPRSIIKSVAAKGYEIQGIAHLAPVDIAKRMIELESEMRRAAEQLDFEKAISLRDALSVLQSSQKWSDSR